MRDILNRSDLEQLMGTFYDRLLADDTINYIFTDIARIDFETHLPHIVDFWEQNILGNRSYRKNVLQIHLDLNSKSKLTQDHFKTWLNHLHTVTDKMFSGKNAENLKTRAVSIATVMQIKLGEQQ